MTGHTTAMTAKTSLPPTTTVMTTAMTTEIMRATIPSTIMGTRGGKDERR
jgi:hypothetical protein